MACAAAKAAVRDRLPPVAARLHREPIPAVSDIQLFTTINWWTIGTIREALAELVAAGEAATEESKGVIRYRKASGAKLR